MREAIRVAIREAEAELGVSFPETVVVFLAGVPGPQVRLGHEDWYFPIAEDPPEGTTLLEMSRAFRDEWKLRGVTIATNGIGDDLVLLPEADGRTLSPIPYVMLHEVAQVREMAPDLATAASVRKLDYIWGDDYVYRLDDDGNPVGYEEQASFATDAPPSDKALEGEGASDHDRKSWLDGLIGDRQFDRAAEIVAGLVDLAGTAEDAYYRGWASFKLGNLYMDGFGTIPRDVDLALKHNGDAVALGHRTATSTRAFWYFEGTGVPRDLQKAHDTLVQANERTKTEDDPEGQYASHLQALRLMLTAKHG
jgi:hypothetical protein